MTLDGKKLKGQKNQWTKEKGLGLWSWADLFFFNEKMFAIKKKQAMRFCSFLNSGHHDG
jgi:hypothetical protein